MTIIMPEVIFVPSVIIVSDMALLVTAWSHLTAGDTISTMPSLRLVRACGIPWAVAGTARATIKAKPRLIG